MASQAKMELQKSVDPVPIKNFQLGVKAYILNETEHISFSKIVNLPGGALFKKYLSKRLGKIYVRIPIINK